MQFHRNVISPKLQPKYNSYSTETTKLGTKKLTTAEVLACELDGLYQDVLHTVIMSL